MATTNIKITPGPIPRCSILTRQNEKYKHYPLSMSFFSDVKECSMQNNVCQNGGTCEEGMGDYHCSCALGYAGKNCDKGMIHIFLTADT